MDKEQVGFLNGAVFQACGDGCGQTARLVRFSPAGVESSPTVMLEAADARSAVRAMAANPSLTLTADLPGEARRVFSAAAAAPEFRRSLLCNRLVDRVVHID